MQTSSALAMALGVTVAFGADFTAERINPSSQALILKELSFEDGHFSQLVKSADGSPMAGRWTAEISRTVDGVTDQLCAGSGAGIYSGTRDTYTPSEWTGDDCPPLLPGDRGEASWQFVNEAGLTQSIGAYVVIE